MSRKRLCNMWLRRASYGFSKRYQDARAHFRIIKRYDYEELRHLEIMVKHDFIDGAAISLLIPMLGLGRLPSIYLAKVSDCSHIRHVYSNFHS